MYGHLMRHPGRGYKGATRPAAFATALVAGGVTPRTLPLKEDFLSARSPAVGLKDGLPAMWPVTVMRGRAPTTAYAVSAGSTAVLEPTRSEEEDAARILLGMSSGDATLEPAKVHMQLTHVPDAVEGHQMSGLELLAAMVTVAPEVEKPKELEPVRDGALVVVRDKKRLVSPAAKKPKKRRLDDLVQTPPNPAPAAEATEVEPPLRRIPSPASDRKYVCTTCGIIFPTYYALGGHVASHTKVSKFSGDQQLESRLAVAHTLHNIMAQHHQRQGGGVVPGAARGLGGVRNTPPPLPAPRDPMLHPCSRCTLVFPSGQALGGHMRKHWIAERQHMEAVAAVAAASAAASAAALAAAAAAARPIVPPRDFDLNEFPME